jgi:hypothetical protein
MFVDPDKLSELNAEKGQYKLVRFGHWEASSDVNV